jgi:hypothetical protein
MTMGTSTARTRVRRVRRLTAGVLAAGLSLAVLTACAGADSSADTGAAASMAEPAPAQEGLTGSARQSSGEGADSSGDLASDDGTSQAGAPNAVALQQRRQIRSGQLSVQVKDVDAAVTNVRATVAAAKGYVADEQTSTRPAQREAGEDPTSVSAVLVDRSVLTVRVPAESLDRVMEQVADVGTVRARSQASQDVTDSYVDTSSRVKSQRASVDRVRALLSRATDIGDVVRLESELARREADLDALEARLAALDDSTTMATLTVTLARPDAIAPAPKDHDGFVGGLLDGWHALGASAAVVLQIVGAVIPFAVLLAFVGLPAWLLLRRRRTSSPAPSA